MLDAQKYANGLPKLKDRDKLFKKDTEEHHNNKIKVKAYIGINFHCGLNLFYL